MEWLNRFWEKVDVQSNNICWNWCGHISPYGYGLLKIRGKHQLAHRLSWLIKHGTIPDHICVLHRCDNRKCVNPHHLFLGTRSDNARDRHIKGRTASGEHNGRARISKLAAISIRASIKAGISRKELAKIWDVGMNVIDKIACGRTWKHLV